MGPSAPPLLPCSPVVGQGCSDLSFSLRLSLSLCFSVRPSLPSRAMSLQMEKQLPGGPAWLPPLDLEKWYQEVMAGFETSSSPLSPCSSPPPLPAKAHSSQKSLQVMPCSPRSPLGQRGAKLRCLGKAPGQGGLKIGCWSPRSHLTSVPPCPGLPCQTGGRQRRAPPSDEEQHPVILAAQHLRAGAQPLAQGRAAGGSRALWGAAA